MRKSVLLSTAVAAAILAASPSFGVTVTWNGLNSVSAGAGGTPGTDPADPANWLPNQVPTVGDLAFIKFNDFHAFTPSPPASNVVVPAANATFTPDSITFAVGNLSDGVSAFIINKNLTMTDITFDTLTTNTIGDMISRLRFATTANVTLTLTGLKPLDFSQSNFQVLNLGWVGNGPTYQNDPGAKTPTGFRTTVDLTNANITFASPSQSAHSANDLLAVTRAGISGGSAQENTTNTNNSTINFTAVGGNVTLETTGARQSGTLATGYAQLNVRSDQVWTADATSLIRVHHKVAAPGFSSAPFMVGSITGARLDNLGQTHWYVDMMNDDFGSGLGDGRGMRIAGGTYGSIQVNTTPSGGNHTWMILNDHVTLASTGVQTGNYAGAVPASTTPYGLTLAAGGAASSGNESSLALNAKNLTVAQGILLDGTTLARTAGSDSAASNNAESMKIDATGSTLTIGGDLVYQSANQSAADSNVDNTGFGDYATRRTGIWGDSSTVVKIGGNFSTNVASMSSFYRPADPLAVPPVLEIPLQPVAKNLSEATVFLNGGASLRTFEVGDASTKVDLSSDVTVGTAQSRLTGGYSIATLNVGDGTTAGNVRLVNNSLNDNAIVNPDGTATSAGEKLLVGTLNIKANSSLDLNGQTAKVLTTATVESTGNLKLGGGTLNGAVSMAGGKLTGAGTVTGNVAAGGGGHTIAPSDSLPAATTNTMTVGGLSTLDTTTLAFHLVTPGASSVNDKIVVTTSGGLTISGAILAITGNSTGAASLGYYKAIQYSGAIGGGGIGSVSLPAVTNNIDYRLDATHDAGFIDIHRGFMGDANDDGTVNFDDFLILSQNFGASGGWSKADFINNGTIDFNDFLVLSQNFGQTIGVSQLTATDDEIAAFHAASSAFLASVGVPEPTSLALLGIGAASLLTRRRKA